MTEYFSRLTPDCDIPTLLQFNVGTYLDDEAKCVFVTYDRKHGIDSCPCTSFEESVHIVQKYEVV